MASPPPRPAKKDAPTLDKLVGPASPAVLTPVPVSAPVSSGVVISTPGENAGGALDRTSHIPVPSIGAMNEASGQWSATSIADAAAAAEAKKDPNIGKVFGGKYEIIRVLGEGGMGIVYGARHKAIGKKFAIKVLHGDAVKDPEVVERFKVEAQAASAIGNEHIVDITDFAELPDGNTYFVMEFLDGKSLTKLFEENHRVPTARLAKIAKQITRGLGAAHTAGIVHRDLKPDNIYLCKRSGGETDFVKILDFGIAKVGASTNKLTKAGAVFGTPHYMSPEQASGSPIDHRTDIYALGVILYEGAVGRVPFDADNFMGILTQHMYKAPVPPRALPECPPDLPAGLEVIIMRCLRKKPEERYQTMEELEEDIDRLVRGEVPKAASDMMALSAGYQSLAQSAISAAMPKPIPGEPMQSSPKKTSWPLYAGIAGVLAVVGIAVFVLVGPGKTNAGVPASNGAQSNDSKSTTSAPASTTAPTAATTAPVAPTTTADVAKKKRIVMVKSNPAVAKVYLDGATKPIGDDIGAQLVELEEGTPKKVVLKAAGYKDETVTLDDQSPEKVVVNLTKLKQIYTPPAVTKNTGPNMGDPDPWANKPK